MSPDNQLKFGLHKGPTTLRQTDLGREGGLGQGWEESRLLGIVHLWQVALWRKLGVRL